MPSYPLTFLDRYEQFICSIAQAKNISKETQEPELSSLNIIYKDVTLRIPALEIV